MYRLRCWTIFSLCFECVRKLPSKALRSHIKTDNGRLHHVLRTGQLFACCGRCLHELPCGNFPCSDGHLDLIVVRALFSRCLLYGAWHKLLGDLSGLRCRRVLDGGRRFELVNLRELLDGLLHRDDGRHELLKLPYRPVRRGLYRIVLCEHGADAFRSVR